MKLKRKLKQVFWSITHPITHPLKSRYNFLISIFFILFLIYMYISTLQPSKRIQLRNYQLKLSNYFWDKANYNINKEHYRNDTRHSTNETTHHLNNTKLKKKHQNHEYVHKQAISDEDPSDDHIDNKVDNKEHLKTKDSNIKELSAKASGTLESGRNETRHDWLRELSNYALKTTAPINEGKNILLKMISSREDGLKTDNNENRPRDCPEHLLGVPISFRELKSCKECQEVTCSELLYSEPNDTTLIYKQAKKLMTIYSMNFEQPNDTDLETVLDVGCVLYKQWRGYDLSAAKKEELEDTPVSDLSGIVYGADDDVGGDSKQPTSKKPYSIAFNVLVHDNFEQAERLIRAIYRPQHFFCVHVDRKNTELLGRMKKLIRCFDNIYLPSTLESVVYQGLSRLMADIRCMEEHLKRGGGWKYLLNTAASAFPLRTSVEMVQILKIYNGTNDIKTIDTRMNTFLQNRFRFEYIVQHLKTGDAMRRSERFHPPPPHNLTIVKGNAYAGFSRGFVEFLLRDHVAKDFLAWCNGTLTPDEHFWNTLHHTYSNPHINAPGGYNGPFDKWDSGPVLVEWYGKFCKGKIRNGICIFGVQDLPHIIASKKFFVNKFLRGFEPLALECLENLLQYRRSCPEKMELNHYRNLKFVRSWNDRQA